MYKSVDLVYPDENVLENKLLKEREPYNEIFQILEDNLQNMIVGGKRANQKINNETITSESYFYEMYSKDPFYDAKRIADSIFTDCKNKDLVMFTSVNTEILNNTISISVNDRPVARIYYMSKLLFDKVVTPHSVNGLFSKSKINVLSVDLQLVETYLKLMGPHNASDWWCLLKLECKLQKIFKKQFSKNLLEKYGGKKPVIVGSRIKEYLDNKNRVLIGPNAIKILKGEKITSNIYYIVTSNNLLDEFNELETLLSVKLDKSYDKNGIPYDSRLHKLTITHNKKPIMILYNTSAFNLVPYILVKDIGYKCDKDFMFVKIGSPYCILLHMFIDLWRIQSATNKGFISKESTFNVISALINYIDELYDFTKKLLDDNNIKLLFPTDYVGKYYDHNTYKRIENYGKFSPPPYMPINKL